MVLRILGYITTHIVLAIVSRQPAVAIQRDRSGDQTIANASVHRMARSVTPTLRAGISTLAGVNAARLQRSVMIIKKNGTQKTAAAIVSEAYRTSVRKITNPLTPLLASALIM